MLKLTQQYYDDIMNYVSLNQRCVGLMSTTRYTGLVRWHNRNHEVYDKINEDITKYIANMYEEYAEPTVQTGFNYAMPSDITTHIRSWISALEPLKMKSYLMYKEACDNGDMCLSDKFKHLNMIVNNELFYLKRLTKRLNGISPDGIMYVNKLIHDYFEENPSIDEIDISL